MPKPFKRIPVPLPQVMVPGTHLSMHEGDWLTIVFPSGEEVCIEVTDALVQIRHKPDTVLYEEECVNDDNTWVQCVPTCRVIPRT